jgi:hypothetical protein
MAQIAPIIRPQPQTAITSRRASSSHFGSIRGSARKDRSGRAGRLDHPPHEIDSEQNQKNDDQNRDDRHCALLPCRALVGESPYPLAALTNRARAGASYPLVKCRSDLAVDPYGLTCRFCFHAKAEVLIRLRASAILGGRCRGRTSTQRAFDAYNMVTSTGP